MAAATFFLCFYCKLSSVNFGEIVDNEIISHPKQELKCIIKRTSEGKSILKTRNFHVIPDEIKSKNKYITANTNSISLNIHDFEPRQNAVVGPSLTKRQRPDELVDHCSPDVLDNQTFIESDDGRIFEKDVLERLSSILPKVISNLRDVGELNSFVQFNERLASGSFPFENIAYRLFCDVVQWYTLSNTSSMRYSELVKRFWRTGYKLFKGKFLRFMSGLKNTGNINEGMSERGKYEPMNSELNFAVPSWSVLDKMITPVSTETFRPGLIDTMINILHENDPDKIATFKLCVDGKKINSSTIGNLGDVNLWGHEDPPTLSSKMKQLDEDKKNIEQLRNILQDIQSERIESISDCAQHIKPVFIEHCINTIQAIGHKIRDLRKAKVGKHMAYDKFLKMTEGDWRKSRYAFVISSLKTSLFEISSCIEDALSCIDKLGCITAEMRGLRNLYCEGKVLDLNRQDNFYCLQIQNDKSDVSDSSIVKQRSDAWHKIRNTAHVTGSTCNKALGLETLKKQQMHYKQVFNEEHVTESPSKELQMRFDYGTANEINCVATLTGKVLPVFYEQSSYFEEGCYTCRNGFTETMPTVIVSPDGSIRNNNGQIILAVEIKCPYPGKTFTTPVQYAIPKYYIPQILCEMAVLKTDKLIFLSYSQESTSVLEASFDESIWTLICKIINDVYGSNHKMPTKLHPLIPTLRQQIDDYAKAHVLFIAEVPSLKAFPCSHDLCSNDSIRLGHFMDLTDTTSTFTTLDDALDVVSKCKTVIETSYRLLRHKASEVLVFLLSGLDRKSKSEMEHAVPIAFALKGYSMSSNIMRKMLKDVFIRCFEKGLYVPVISFDGQWYNLCVRSNTGEPMTLLQLQKDVFKKSKAKTKTSILQMIFSLNRLSSSDSFESLESKVHVQYTRNADGKFEGCITVGTTFSEKKPLTPSSHTVSMITSFIEGKKFSSNTPVDGDCPMLNTSDRDLEDHIFSAIPNDDVDKIDNRLKVELEQLNESICLELQQEQRVTISSTDVITYDSFSTVTSTEDPLSLHEISQTLDNDNHSNNSEDVFCLNENDYQTILDHLRLDKSLKIREKLDQNSLKKLFLNPSAMSAVFNKKTILACLKSIACKLKDKKIHFLISWPKYKITEFLNHIAVGIEVKKVVTSRRKNVLSLQKLCEKVIRTFSKDILNIVDAEYAFPLEKQKWILDMPFEDNLEICGLTKQINWFSKPEYSRETSSFKFFLLDCHHILTNARIKCCKTGIPEAGIHRQAWMKLTTSEHGNILSKALVEDLVDCQSNSFAQQTFSQKVEDAMRLNGDNNEAMFCRLIREWYTAEDDPGIDVHERCMRRLALRQWLLKDVSLNKFPPPGAFIKGIPIVMYEGLLTNIDRRLQLFPFVKTGMYNVRSLGTLEAENLFGAFQDLDPKGSGVIRPDDIPSALSTSCEMLCYRFNKNRGFHLQTSRARVYPFHELLELQSITPSAETFSIPSSVKTLQPRNHPFDRPERSKLTGTRRRVKSCISDPSMPARGIRPIRQFHRLDESKILPHVRKGLEFNDESEDI